MIHLKEYNIFRLILNIAFTSFILFAAVDNSSKNLPVSFILLYNVLLFLPAWSNNFWLLPDLRRTKNIKRYLVCIISIFIFGVFILGNYVQYVYDQFNNSSLEDLTALAVTSSAPRSIEKHQSYFDVFPGILMILLVMIIGYVVQEYLSKIKKEEQIQTQNTIAELSLLRSQISPHFLFNVLNSLYALSLKKADETPDVILKLSDILRYSLYESQGKEIPVADEIHILKTYIDIEQLRAPENTNITFEYTINDSVKIAPMLLLPLIENAFKHGIDSSIDASYINASLSCNSKELIFTCKNSFKEASKSKNFGGIGIKNIRKRLQLLYPMKHSLEIIKNENRFDVILKVKF
jgi:hypothetical protein